MTQRDKIIGELKKLEHDYQRYQDPAVATNIEAQTLRRLWDGFGSSMLPIGADPQLALFNTGRIYEAFEPYRSMLNTITRYKDYEKRLIEEDERQKQAEQDEKDGVSRRNARGRV